MKDIHYFKKSQQEEIPFSKYNSDVTAKLLLGFLCDLYEWSRTSPYIYHDTIKNNNILYAIYRDITFSVQDFWQTFGDYFTVLHQRWQIEVFGSELFTQKPVNLSFEKQNNKLYAVQKTVSGQYEDTINSFCLRVQGFSADEINRLYLLCQATNWQNGILTADWSLSDIFEKEHISWLHTNSCYCYGSILENFSQEKILDTLNFSQKIKLWTGFLKNNLSYIEFDWLYDEISSQTLSNRSEWELALYTVLNRLDYTLKVSDTKFELYDGQSNPCYFSFNSENAAQKVLLKLLFPI